MKNEYLDFLISNWPLIAGLIYELSVRFFPTSKSFSLVTLAIRLINSLVPDKNKFGGLHTIIFLLLSLASFGQNNYNAISVRYTPQDTATISSNYKIRGATIRQSNTDSIYIYNRFNHWALLNGSGSGSSFTASNGLTKVANDFQLGGTLTVPTEINGDQPFDVQILNNSIASNYTSLSVDINTFAVQSNKHSNGSISLMQFNDNADNSIRFSTGKFSDLTYHDRITIDSVGFIKFPNTSKFEVDLNNVSFASNIQFFNGGSSGSPIPYLQLSRSGAGITGLTHNSLLASNGFNVGTTSGNLTISTGASDEVHFSTPNLYISGTKIGFFSTIPVTQQSGIGATLTNSVTSGGSANIISDFNSLTVYATDAGTIRNDIYQLAEKLRKIEAALKAYGIIIN